MSRLSIRSPENLLSGFMFVGIGLGTVYVAADYPMGTLRRMGPGMLPIILGLMLCATGIALAVQSVLAGEHDPDIEAPNWAAIRAAFFVLLSMLAFALLMRPAGMFIATMVLVLTASRAERGYPLLTAIILSVVLAGVAVGIFVYGLGLPFRVWP